MTIRRTRATAARVGAQLRRDPRTVGLLLAVPTLLVVLLHEIFAGDPSAFQRIGGPLLGIFPFVSMFVVSSVTMLRERITGTLERLMAMPIAKLDLLGGYAAAFALMAAIQVSLVSAVALGPLDLEVARPVLVVAIAVANALLGMSLGLFASAFARSEFQAVQFMPAIVLPQFLLCGLLVSRDQMADWLQVLSALMPLTYAYEALEAATSPAPLEAAFVVDVAIVVAVTLAALGAGAGTLRRRTP